jgi:hypothetical protein
MKWCGSDLLWIAPAAFDGIGSDLSQSVMFLQELSRAYEILRDPVLRKEYDDGRGLAL